MNTSKPRCAVDAARLPFGPPHACTIHAHFHVYKYGGTAVRSLFHSQKSFGEWYWYSNNGLFPLSWFAQAWRPAAGGIVSSVRPTPQLKPIPPLEAYSNWFLEQHGGTLSNFVQGLEQLQPIAHSHGCTLTSSTLLRQPIDAMISQYFYDRQTPNSTSPAGLHHFITSRPEFLLLGCRGCHGPGTTGLGLQEPPSPRHPRHPPCETLLRQANALLERLDIVGTVEAGAASLTMLANASHLQALPTVLHSNGHSALQLSAERRDKMRADRAEAQAGGGRAWSVTHNCSLALFEQWATRFGVRTRPAHEGGSYDATMASVQAQVQSALDRGSHTTSQPTSQPCTRSKGSRTMRTRLLVHT